MIRGVLLNVLNGCCRATATSVSLQSKCIATRSISTSMPILHMSRYDNLSKEEILELRKPVFRAGVWLNPKLSARYFKVVKVRAIKGISSKGFQVYYFYSFCAIVKPVLCRRRDA